MSDAILVINAGSSSIKFSIYTTAPDRPLSPGAHGQVEGIGEDRGISPRIEVADAQGRKLIDRPIAGRDHVSAMTAIHDWFAGHVGSETGFAGVGHRVVHGGLRYSKPVLIDGKVLAALEQLVPLAPLHQPHNLAAIRAISVIAPKVPQVACFDTAFHRSQKPLAQEFALPRELTAKGVRRYGFHGLSYEYIASVLPQIAPDCADGKVIVAHLGNGASMCAIEAGRSIATTMGFTAVDGLPMGTRTGTLDPGVILYLLQHEGMDAQAVEHLIYERSGLLGVSALSGDMRTLLASDLPAAKEAVDLFVYRIGRELGSLTAALGGLDAIVFTAGIGEHAAEIRARVCNDAQWIGIALDGQANAAGGPRISRPASEVSAWVIPTDENLMIARHTRRLLDAATMRSARTDTRPEE
ncbi:MAG: acetate/propionate family kinase [Xanthobacteraceae bacterium]